MKRQVSGVAVVIAIIVVIAIVLMALWWFTGPRGPREEPGIPEDPTTGEDPRYLTPASAEEREEMGADAEYGPGVPERGR